MAKNYLVHHGILGMKWGVRRYQNPDGTYTEEGKRRRRDDDYSDDYKRYKKLSKRSTKELSTKELEEINRRDNAVINYNKNHTNSGKRFVQKLGSKIMDKSLEALAVGIVAAGTVYFKTKIKGK